MKQLFLSTTLAFLLLTISVSAQATKKDILPGAPVAETPSRFSAEAVQAWLIRTFAGIEKFRTEEAVHFATERDTKKAELKIDEVKTFDEEAVLEQTSQDESPSRITPKTEKADFFAYPSYVLSISLASFFENQIIFYISSLLLIFIAFRFLVSRLV